MKGDGVVFGLSILRRLAFEQGVSREGSIEEVLFDLGAREIDGELVNKPAVAGKAKEYAPRGSLRSTLSTRRGQSHFGPERDPHSRPAVADVGDDTCHFVLGAGRCVDVRSPKLRRHPIHQGHRPVGLA